MKITSEEPEIHWPFLKVKDKVVLDLGCGIFYSQQAILSLYSRLRTFTSLNEFFDAVLSFFDVSPSGGD